MNYSKPRVSIGMPVYNGDRFIKEILDAILAQTFEDFELIISDNASTDRTQEICHLYAARDKRIKYYRNEHNIGGHRNFNRVFELAIGEYFRWAAHDDLCAPENLERCVEVLEQHPDVVLCYTKTKLIDEHGKVLDQNYDENPLLTNSPLPHIRFCNLIVDSFSRPYRGQQLYGVMRTSAAATTSLLEDYSGADMVFLARMSLMGKFYEVPEYLFFNRNHSQRSTGGAMVSPYLRAAWFDPNAKAGKLVFPKWRVFFGYLNSIKEVPLSPSEQIRCYLHAGTWLSKHWDVLVKEVLKAAVWPLYFSLHRRRMFLEKNKASVT